MSNQNIQYLYIVDDEELLRKSLSAVLESSGYPVRAFPSGQDFLETLPDLVCSCVILDVQMRGMDGLQVLERLKQSWPDAPVIMISGFADIAMAVKAIQSGASDFIEKPFQPEDVLDTLKRVFETSCSLKEENVRSTEADAPLSSLTEREVEVLSLLVQGKQHKVIAWELGISPRTVEVHRARIMQRLGVTSFAELVRLVVLSGLKVD